MPDAQEYWKNRIEHDLASFGDPGCPVRVNRSGRSFRAQWTMRGDDREAVFSPSSGRSMSVSADGRSLDYPEFLAGPDMADLKHVARMIFQGSERRLFIPTKAERTDIDPAPLEPALDVLKKLLNEESADATRIIMVTGDAGAGKTRVLEELVRHEADGYLRGQTSKLLLYVNAQGRALARLNEALATELQDLKVSLTYHSVAVLTRLGILIPVIDGFDELLGVSGYDDAFGSLAGFLEQLEGDGQLLTSARSVYYEEEFLSRAGSVSAAGGQVWSHTAVRVREWSNDDQKNYVRKWAKGEGLSDDEADSLYRRVHTIFTDQHETLASKPLFFARTVDLLRRNRDFSAGGDLLGALVGEYLTRERTEKLLDREQRPMLTTVQFERLMRELAQEMWNQETRELDHRSVRDVAEYVVESEDLPDAAKQAIIERMPTLAFLARGEGALLRAGIAFEHELLFFYFLARSIVPQIASTDVDIRVVLSRSALPEEVADRVAAGLTTAETETPEHLQQRLERLATAATSEWRRTTQVRENAGLLTMALCREYAGSRECGRIIDGCVVRSVIFPGSHLEGVNWIRCSFMDVMVRRTNLTRTRFVECEAQNMLFFEPLVDTAVTRFDLSGLDATDVTGIQLADARRDTSYVPSFVARTLVECGAPIQAAQQRLHPCVRSEYLELLERLMHAYHRANPVCTADGNLSKIFQNGNWGSLERMLLEHKIVTKEHRSTSGQSKTFLRRRFLPEQIMAGMNDAADVDVGIRAFWRALKSEQLID